MPFLSPTACATACTAGKSHEFFGLDDECVLFTVPVGAAGEVGRALAVDGSLTNFDGLVSGGDVWVGLQYGEAFVHLDGESGQVLERVETPGFRPFDATFDAFGNLYAISLDGFLLTLPRARASELTVEAVPLACYLLYGLAADADGRLLMTGFSCTSFPYSSMPPFSRPPSAIQSSVLLIARAM